jgi:hypothetical protein
MNLIGNMKHELRTIHNSRLDLLMINKTKKTNHVDVSIVHMYMKT